MARWRFLTNHARALVFIAQDPGVRLRDLAAALDITERSAYAIVMDLSDDGYIVKEKHGRRNRYHIEPDMPLPETVGRPQTIGQVLNLLSDAGAFADAGACVCEPGLRSPLALGPDPSEPLP
ncbi:MAG: AsnC family transcriptional regulator [Actinomycetota bacterium]|nr:AsnC family transcriptional regulator [Actinomycetota bacterium]